jgi:hypothetical protein
MIHSKITAAGQRRMVLLCTSILRQHKSSSPSSQISTFLGLLARKCSASLSIQHP